MLVIISICFFLIDFIRSLNKMTTSLRSFLLDSVFLELISVVVLFDIFNKIAHLGNNLYDFIIQYVLIVLAITISWSIVSCMANNKVATLANIILSTAIGLMIYIKDAIFDVLPDSLFQKYDSSDFLISIGYTPKGIVQAVKMGIPVGYVTKYAGYHGSSAALHTFYMLSEQNFSTLKNDKSMDKGPVFHYTLNDDQKKQLLNIVDTALKDPEYAKCLELPKKTTPMKKKSMGRK